MGSHAGVSTRRELVWQALSFQFMGNGQVQRIGIVLEGGNASATSVATQRGALIDDIRIVETLPVRADLVYGLADAPAALPQVSVTASSSFGGEQISLVLEGLAVGSVLGDGVRSVAITAQGQAPELSGWSLQSLQLLPPAGFTGDMVLTLRATSTEASNGASAGVSVSVTLRVLTGLAAVTPVTINGFVTSTTVTGARSVSVSAQAAPVAALDETLTRSAAAYSLTASTRSPQDEVAQAAERARALSDAWLKELEERAKQQWQQLVGGN